MPVCTIRFKDMNEVEHLVSSDDEEQIRRYINDKYTDGYVILSVDYRMEGE